ncbi:MAG: PIN domain-containing protein [Chloroflexota bacterium]|nr:PIN domain-containing protein [Chloroflexota bacterium]
MPDNSPNVPRIVTDANVLFPATLRDTCFRLQEESLAEVRLSSLIWEEVTRNLVGTGRVTRTQAIHLEQAAQAFFEIQGMLVEGFEFLIPTLTCDPKDRHVLAAAIQGRAATIVTANLRDFPRASLAPFGITAEHPDTFLLRLFVSHASELVTLVQTQAADKTRPPQTTEQLLDALAVHVPKFVARVRATVQT